MPGLGLLAPCQLDSRMEKQPKQVLHAGLMLHMSNHLQLSRWLQPSSMLVVQGQSFFPLGDYDGCLVRAQPVRHWFRESHVHEGRKTVLHSERLASRRGPIWVEGMVSACWCVIRGKEELFQRSVKFVVTRENQTLPRARSSAMGALAHRYSDLWRIRQPEFRAAPGSRGERPRLSLSLRRARLRVASGMARRVQPDKSPPSLLHSFAYPLPCPAPCACALSCHGPFAYTRKCESRLGSHPSYEAQASCTGMRELSRA